MLPAATETLHLSVISDTMGPIHKGFEGNIVQFRCRILDLHFAVSVSPSNDLLLAGRTRQHSLCKYDTTRPCWIHVRACPPLLREHHILSRNSSSSTL